VVVTHPTEYELYLFYEGNLFESYKIFGAHIESQNGQNGTRFTVWAPRATQVHVVGDFNNWNGTNHEMTRLTKKGIWSLFIPGLLENDIYKYQIKIAAGDTILN
jgi:1,4-alpha-glucan branching enzyme